ncbi:MAG: LL-diaminopimelate aminotransferase, partial [Butyricicoccus sp.]|nr:LL-diaminopimelate aminotransferase [Butyricicoccus sp.]
WYTGGKNSPYLWLRCPGEMDAWRFFDYLLENANVVGTPGAGFGRNGSFFFRLTAFGDQQRTREAAERFKQCVRAL